MTFQVGLNIITLIMCILTLAMASAALMPQIKQALALLRDGLLWLILISVIGLVGVVGWGRLIQARQAKAQSEVTPSVIWKPVMTGVEPRMADEPSVAFRRPNATFAIQGNSTGGTFAPNRSWPTSSHASAGNQ